MDFLTELPSIPLNMSAILGTAVPPALWAQNLLIFSLSMPTAGTNYVLGSVAAAAIHAPNNIVSSYKCTGILPPSTILELRSPLIFLKHTTK